MARQKSAPVQFWLLERERRSMKDGWVYCPDCGKKLLRIQNGRLYVWCKGEKKEVVINLNGEEAEKRPAR